MNEEDFHRQVDYIRDRARKGLSLTGRQAKLLVRERDFTMQMGMGFLSSLTTLRPFMADDAPQWAKDKVKLDSDHNKMAIESAQKFMFEISQGKYIG